MSVADMAVQGDVVFFSKKMSFEYHSSDTGAIEFARRNNVCEENMEVESVNQRSFLRQASRKSSTADLHSWAIA